MKPTSMAPCRPTIKLNLSLVSSPMGVGGEVIIAFTYVLATFWYNARKSGPYASKAPRGAELPEMSMKMLLG